MRKRNTMLKMAATAAVLCVLTGCASTSSMLKAVDQGDYLEANQLYAEKVQGHTDLETEVEQGLETRIEDAITAYNREELSYDDARAVVERIERCDICSYATLADAYDRLNVLARSKNCYQAGEEAYEAADYKQAMEQYAQVFSEDQNFDAAQEKHTQARAAYRGAVLEAAAAEAEQADYDSALETLEVANLFLETDPELEAQIQKYRTEQADHQAAEILRQADELLAQEQYAEAYSYLSKQAEALPERTDVQEALKDCREAYKASALDQAEQALLVQRDYAKASSIMSQTLITLGEDPELAEKRDYYRSFQPVWIGDLESFMSVDETNGFFGEDGYFYSYDRTIEDNAGNQYDNYFYLMRTSNGTNMIVYRLDGTKNRLTGKVIVAKADKNRKDLGWIKIYADDQLVFDSGTMAKGSLPVDVDVSLEGAAELKIESHVLKGNYTSCGAYLVNAYLSRDIPPAPQEQE